MTFEGLNALLWQMRPSLTPTRFFVSKSERLRMEDFRQNLQGFHKTRSRTIEVLIAVSVENATVADGVLASSPGTSFSLSSAIR